MGEAIQGVGTFVIGIVIETVTGTEIEIFVITAMARLHFVVMPIVNGADVTELSTREAHAPVLVEAVLDHLLGISVMLESLEDETST